ncbi:hypothetical protein E0I74_34400 [Rhizobium laguerreae]|uniref:Uncharacterized protein n=1 Tax=Rhizobium leguminosarum TaxID=384 RepID=A0A6P0DT55_RHILE|nr:hypothetical protein [Rhizobium leguminosarum]OOO49321.1 hypothetical protein BS630_15255 [Rhizobium laguerreae]TBZ44305.1 hypothetical protein E0H47_00105 [Rhizobium leguminosarum bv. viciae]MBY5325433.1 hypothetical protein [Rhizobium leguminosarum]MBY5385395.1 hypothetical protein [Rhizobium leguminosarum]NEH46522.1 hypothetical protein [Rhizobium leguminosarum]
MDMQTSFLDRLFESGLLIDTGIDGLYGRSGIAPGRCGRDQCRLPKREPLCQASPTAASETIVDPDPSPNVSRR